MAVLLDPARWPAHGTLFGHLVSDTSLAELHAYAAAHDVSPRAFDHDHYDVPAAAYPRLLAGGARAVPGTELARRLVASGLRVRPRDRTPRRAAAERAARADWDQLLPDEPALGEDLLARWSAPGRHYHDVRHLASCLAALDRLGGGDREVRLAAWFHDAVYAGEAGTDEEASARLAEQRLAGVRGPDRAEVARLVRLTATHDPEPGDRRGALLCDADLSVLGSVPGRYDTYARDVRLDFAHVPDEAFRAGRRAVLEDLLGRDRLFRTGAGRDLWEGAARANLARELAHPWPA